MYWKYYFKLIVLGFILVKIYLLTKNYNFNNPEGNDVFPLKSSSFTRQNYCETEKKYQSIDLKSFLIDDEQKIIYCWIHKVASSLIIDLFGKTEKSRQKNLVQGKV